MLLKQQNSLATAETKLRVKILDVLQDKYYFDGIISFHVQMLCSRIAKHNLNVWATDSCLSKPDFVSSFGIKRLQKVLFV
jgi:hypothetical protein